MSQCLGHTWYMPNDMQFHMISPLAIIPLCLAPIIGLNVIFLLVTISVISTAVIAAVNNFSANQLDALVAGQQTDSLGPVSELIDIYIKPYCRVGVYAMGILVGYILFRTKRKLHLNAVRCFFVFVFLFFSNSAYFKYLILFCTWALRLQMFWNRTERQKIEGRICTFF